MSTQVEAQAPLDYSARQGSKAKVSKPLNGSKKAKLKFWQGLSQSPPDLNPVELLWQDLKRPIHAGVVFINYLIYFLLILLFEKANNKADFKTPGSRNNKGQNLLWFYSSGNKLEVVASHYQDQPSLW